MAVEDVARALMALDRDPELRRRVAAGDFGALAGVALTVEEQRLVSEATPVLPEGHPAKVLVPLGAAEVEAHSAEASAGYWPAGTARAIEYVQGGLGDPVAQAEFAGWQRSMMDKIP